MHEIASWFAPSSRFVTGLLGFSFGLFDRRSFGRRLIFLARRNGVFERSRDQIVTRAHTINKGEHVIVGVAFTYRFDASFILQTRELGHHKILLRSAHKTIVDIKRETGRMRRRFDRYGVAVVSPDDVLILIRSHE